VTHQFTALLLTEQGKPQLATLDSSKLMDGDVTVDVEYSTLNYKDGLALTGRLPSMRRLPFIPGIDFAGTVVESTHTDFAVGDRVVQNGFGVGETHHGGFATRARVKGDWLVKLPEAISCKQALMIGTAGYTAALSVMALERAGVTPDSGDVLVTGAAGGTGGVAVTLLAGLGYRVVASSRRALEQSAYLRELGATEIVDADTLVLGKGPLSKERWAGAVDCVGSQTLAAVLAATRYGGTVTACGLAQGTDLPTSVLPFILRGVSLLGIDSVMAPLVRRRAAWSRLARDLDLSKLAGMTQSVALGEVAALAAEILAGKIRGRIVVDLSMACHLPAHRSAGHPRVDR
jgi:acrylyl-CoA reductase (NADPH)